VRTAVPMVVARAWALRPTRAETASSFSMRSAVSGPGAPRAPRGNPPLPLRARGLDLFVLMAQGGAVGKPNTLQLCRKKNIHSPFPNLVNRGGGRRAGATTLKSSARDYKDHGAAPFAHTTGMNPPFSCGSI